MKNNQNFYEEMFKKNNINVSSKDIEKAKGGDISSLMSHLDKNDAKKVNDILKDKNKVKEVLSSESAKRLIEMLGGKM